MNESVFNNLVNSSGGLQWAAKRIHFLLKNKNINKSGYSPNKNINYFDLGTHKPARELNWVFDEVLSKLPNPFRLFAFEANPKTFNIAKNNCSHIDNLKFHNLALVSKVPESGLVRLYTSSEGGADSIYRKKESYIEVEAKKLSDVIRDEAIRLDECINIIRMNIEGSEFDVIEDLIESDLIKYFDGFYGMWDDVFKLDKEKFRKFNEMLKEVNVHPFPFNGRDMQREKRKALINKSLMNSILGYEFGE
jgi:FkbM family methyltransferase